MLDASFFYCYIDHVISDDHAVLSVALLIGPYGAGTGFALIGDMLGSARELISTLSHIFVRGYGFPLARAAEFTMWNVRTIETESDCAARDKD